jgi:hypothetical protein
VSLVLICFFNQFRKLDALTGPEVGAVLIPLNQAVRRLDLLLVGDLLLVSWALCVVTRVFLKEGPLEGEAREVHGFQKGAVFGVHELGHIHPQERDDDHDHDQGQEDVVSDVGVDVKHLLHLWLN